MLRAFFLAIGISLAIVGGECLLIEKAVLAESTGPIPNTYRDPGALLPTREVRPPEGLPWLLLSAGTVVVLYSFTIPKRVATG